MEICILVFLLAFVPGSSSRKHAVMSRNQGKPQYRGGKKFTTPKPDHDAICKFILGDGTGAGEIRLHIKEGIDCIDACLERKKTDASINGVTKYMDTSKSGCWCEKGMKGRNTNSEYKSCFLQTNDTLSPVLEQLKECIPKVYDVPEYAEIKAAVTEAIQYCIEDPPCKGQLSGKATQLQKIASGLDMAANIADGIGAIINNKAFGAIANTLTFVAPFLASAGPLVAFLSLFQDSEELQRLNKLKDAISAGFKRVDDKFDLMGVRLHQVKSLLHKKDFWQNIHSDLETLSSTVYVVTSYLNTEKPKVRASRFNNVNSTCRFKSVMYSLNSIYDAFKGKHRTGTLCDVVMKYTDGSAPELVAVSSHIINAVIHGAQRLLIIMEALGRASEDISEKEEEMADMVKEMITMSKTCETYIREDHWTTTWKERASRKLTESPNTDRTQVAKAIYNELHRTYPWRRWMVAVYDSTGEPKYTEMREKNDNFKYKITGNNDYVFIVNTDKDAVKPVLTAEEAQVPGVTRTTGFLGLFWPVQHHTIDRIFEDLQTKSKNKDMKIIGVVLDGDGARKGNKVKFGCWPADSCEQAVIDNEGTNHVTQKFYRAFLLF